MLKGLILYDMGLSAKSQVKFAVIRCANLLVFEFEGVENIAETGLVLYETGRFTTCPR